MNISVATLLWTIRIWSLLVGSGALPCVLLFLQFRKQYRREPSSVYRSLKFDYLSRAIEHLLLLSIFLLLPTEPRIPGRMVPLVFSAAIAVVLLWMFARLAETIEIWLMSISVLGLMNGRKKP